MLSALSTIEWSVEAFLAVAAVVVALGTAVVSARSEQEHKAPGEMVWTAVAIAVLALVAAAVGSGGSHAG